MQGHIPLAECFCFSPSEAHPSQRSTDASTRCKLLGQLSGLTGWTCLVGDAGFCVPVRKSHEASAVFCWPVKHLHKGASLAAHFSKLESSHITPRIPPPL